VHVNYYEAPAWIDLPSAGLSSLSPYMSEWVGNINYPSTTGVFAGSGRNIEVAALFQGYLKFPFPDSYWLCITSDDGSKLFIDDTLVIDNGGLNGYVEKCSFYDGAGVSKVEVEYFQRGGKNALFLSWVPMSRPPNFTLMVVISSSDFVQKPSDTPTDVPTSLPTGNPCDGKTKNECKKNSFCKYDTVKKFKECIPKKEHDCSQYSNKSTCKAAAKEACVFDNNSKVCSHKCAGKTKKSACKKVKNSKEKSICKYQSDKNPCFKCHPKSCGM